MVPDNLNPSKEGKGIRWAPELLGRELKEPERVGLKCLCGRLDHRWSVGSEH